MEALNQNNEPRTVAALAAVMQFNGSRRGVFSPPSAKHLR
jgi:hypothetical protein